MLRKSQIWFSLLVLGFALQLHAEDKKTTQGKPVEVRFLDGGTMKLFLETDSYEFATPYGKLSVPVSDIRLIELGTRVPEEIAKQVEEAIANCGSPQFEIREKAVADLIKLGGKAFPALVRAKKSDDLEVRSRLDDVIEQIRATLNEAQADTRDFDVVHTGHSRISGTLNLKSIQATSSQFGTVEMKLTDVRDLRFEPSEEELDLAKVEAAPASLYDRIGQVGKVFIFKVTGNSTGSVWGTDTYTGDSSLATAAVHSGVVKHGQTGVVKVKIVDPPASFLGTTKNGVTTYPYGSFPGAFKVLKVK